MAIRLMNDLSGILTLRYATPMQPFGTSSSAQNLQTAVTEVAQLVRAVVVEFGRDCVGEFFLAMMTWAK